MESESKIFFYSCLDSDELKIWFERVQRGISEVQMISLNFQFSFKWRTFCSICIYILFFTWNHFPSNSIIHDTLYVTFQPVKRVPSSRLTRTEFMKQCNFISPVYEGGTRSKPYFIRCRPYYKFMRYFAYIISPAAYRRLYPRRKVTEGRVSFTVNESVITF